MKPGQLSESGRVGASPDEFRIAFIESAAAEIVPALRAVGEHTWRAVVAAYEAQGMPRREAYRAALRARNVVAQDLALREATKRAQSVEHADPYTVSNDADAIAKRAIRDAFGSP